MTTTPSAAERFAERRGHYDARSRDIGILPVAAALALLVGGGIAHGMLTGRWQAAPDSIAVPASTFSALALQIGEWDGRDLALDEAEREAAGATSHLQRVYTNRATGESVTVTVLCGPAGPIAVHLPTACYQGAGYEQRGMTRTAYIPTTTSAAASTIIGTTSNPGSEHTVQHQFLVADFHMPARPEIAPPQIYWAWSTDGIWQIPDNPRLEFSGQPRLCKLYVTTTRPLSATSAPGTIEDFLTLMLPELQTLLSTDLPPNHSRAAAFSH